MLFILFGLGLGVLVVSIEDQVRSQYIPMFAIQQTIDVEAMDLLPSLDREFANIIRVFQTQANIESKRVKGRDVGYNNGLRDDTELEYGFCDSQKTFYLYIFDPWEKTSYAYLSGSTPSDCHPPGWHIEAQPVGESKWGGTWYEFRFDLSFAPPVTSTPRPLPTRIPTLTP